MAIAFDATASGTVSPGTSLTFSHTCTGSNLILFVGVDTGNASGGTDVVSGITYNAVSMTRINTTATGGGANRRSYLYYLLNPSTGANNVVVSTSSSTDIRAASASYTGAQQSGVPDASTTNTATAATSITTTVTTVADNCWVVSSMDNDQGTPTAGAGLTIRSSTSPMGIGDNNAAKTPAGAVSLTWNLPASGDSGVCQASFAPSLPAGPGVGYAFII